MPDYGSNIWDDLEDIPEIVEYVDEGEAIAWSIHDALVTGESLEFRKKLRDD